MPTPTVNDAPADLAELKQGLVELEALLLQRNMRSTRLVKSLQQLGGGALGADFDALCDAIAALDFSTALDHLRALQQTLGSSRTA